MHFISNIEVRSDYETTLSTRSEMYIFVPKSEQIGFGSDLHTSTVDALSVIRGSDVTSTTITATVPSLICI
jgi:hypothetical protein